MQRGSRSDSNDCLPADFEALCAFPCSILSVEKMTVQNPRYFLPLVKVTKHTQQVHQAVFWSKKTLLGAH